MTQRMVNVYTHAELANWKEGVSDAVAEMSYAWDEFTEAKTVLVQATALERLSNAMNDVLSWHPRFDIRTGQIEGIYEDEP